MNDSGWFKLKDVYYEDLTGDKQAGAIVRLSHVACGVSCDGSADIFYIYTTRNGKLKNIWRYGTGSYAYGCGLKTFALGNKEIVLQLLASVRGRQWKIRPAKFVVEDLTFIQFEFDGSRFVTKSIEYIPEPARNVKNYKPEIRIY